MHALRIERLYRSTDLIHIKNPKNIISYQASSKYNLEEFPGVITNWCHCRGEETEAHLPWETTEILDLMIDKSWTLLWL